MIRLEVVKGTSASWEIQGRTRLVAGVPQGFLVEDALSAKVWPGDDRATVLSPTAVWVDAASCVARVLVDGGQTTAVAPGSYRLLVLASRDGRSVAIAEAEFVVLPAPGSAAERPSYCTAEDLLNECGWIDQVADLGADQTGFAEQRADAREWFDGLLLAAYQGGGQSQAFEGVPTWGRSSLLSDPWLAGILAAGGLVLAGPRGRKAVKANVYHALAQVFRTKLAPGDKYAIYGDLYARKASKEAKTLIAEVDTNADGVADLALPLCVSNTRRG